MKHKTARTIIYACMVAVILFGMLAGITMHWILFVLTGLALLAELIVFFIFLRCPHCGRHLDRVGMRSDITHCPFCGKELGE